MSNRSALIIRFAVPICAWLLFYNQSIINMIGVWNHSKTYEYCYLIIPISLWLVWQDKHKFSLYQISSAKLPLVLLSFFCALWIVGKTANISLFEHIAAVCSLQLIIWALVGTQVAKAYYFPLAYLVFTIPFGEELIPYLQEVTANFSVMMVRLTGIPIYREGLYLTIPNGRFEIAEACSGIRFLISSLALGTLFAHIFLRKWWKFALFVIFSATFPIVANGLRAYGIIIIGYLSDMKYATGADHLIYGWLFFSLVTFLIFCFAWLFRDPLQSPKDDKVASITNKTVISENPKITYYIIALFAAFMLWDNSISVHRQIKTNPSLIFPKGAIQANTSDWGINFPNAELSALKISQDKQEEFFSAVYSFSEQNSKLISQDNRIFNIEDWSLVKQHPLSLSSSVTGPFQGSVLDIVRNNGGNMRILYWYCINDYCSTNKVALKLKKTALLMSGKAVVGRVYALASYSHSDEQLLQIANNWISQDK